MNVPFGQSLNQSDSSKLKSTEGFQDTIQPNLVKTLENQKQSTSPKIASGTRSNQSWWNDSWKYRKQITINHTRVAGDLVNFPVLVMTTMNTSKVQHNGADIVFTDNYGIKLNHEIESYDYNTGSLIVWVNVSALSSYQDTVLYMYYGNPNCINQEYPTKTWDTNNILVYHMNDYNDSMIKDVTSNRNNGTKYGTTYPTESTGKIGKAQYFNGNASCYMISSKNIAHGSNPWTYECWYKADSYGHSEDPYPPDQYSILFSISSGNENNNLVIDIAPRNSKDRCRCFMDSYVNYGYSYTNNLNVFDNQWHYAVVVRDNSASRFKIYIDGSPDYIVGSLISPGYIIQTEQLEIGGIQVYPYRMYYEGFLDEIRVSNITRSPQWIHTSYNTMNSPSDFISIGEEELRSIPYANFTYTPVNPTNHTIIHFIDTSTDINGTIVSWWWDFGDYHYSDLQNPTYLYYIDGEYNVTLTVTDNYTNNNSTQKTILVYTSPNHPPNIPGNPFPSNGTTGIPINVTLSWIGGDPDNNTVTYDVYFGTNSLPPKVTNNQSVTTYNPGSLYHSKTYYWKIVAWDNHSASTLGPLWCFATKVNTPPVFGNPSSLNGSTGNLLNFTWSISISDPEGDMFSWSIQCSNGQANSETGASNGTKSLVLSGLAYSTTYKVWVNATDPTGSGLWTRRWYTFNTKANQPPNPPTIKGPAKGKAGTATAYNFTAIDHDGDEIYYFIDWGDNSSSGWIGPYPSSHEITQSHTWSKGTYTIKAKTKDSYDDESGWATLSVTMPYSYSIPFWSFWEKLFERFPHAFSILRQLMGY
jgi:PKD repeat protein